MATIYFTNTANSGNGSLRSALALATAEDVVAPDPAVFRSGERVIVTLSSSLTITKSTTLVSGATRPQIASAAGIAIYAREGGEFLRIDGYEIVGRVIAYFPESTFTRCFFGGNAEPAHLIQGSAGVSIALTDCLLVGARYSGIYATGAGSTVTLTRTTIAGCARNCAISSATTLTAVDSIVDPVCSTSGFASPPPDALSEDSGALPWREWNLAPLATSRYATGATTCAGARDLLGLERGREVDGATVYAFGALEVVEADYYLSGAGGSFSDATNWRTTRGGATSPSSVTSGVFLVTESATWEDSPPEGSTLIVAGRRSATLEADARLSGLVLGADATLVFSGADRVVRSASVSATGATLTSSSGGAGYLAVASGVDVSGAFFDGVASLAYGSELTSFSATSTRPGMATLSWNATGGSGTILLERRDPTGRWRSLGSSVSSTLGSFETATGSGRARFRAFDGEEFWQDDAWSFSGVQLSVVSAAVASDRASQGWEVVTVVSGTSDSVKVGQGVTILARIFDAFDRESPLLSDGSNVESVTYSCYYVTNGLFEETLTPVPGHEEVAAGADCVLEAAQLSDAWTVDAGGYTFVLTPDIRTSPLFTKPGEYQLKVVVRLATGNPVTFYTPIRVV